MLGSAGRSEFFAREASDYLRALEPLLGEAPPEGDAFVRLARALRGAAMLAGPASYTRAASLLEQIARRAQGPGIDWAGEVARLREAHAIFSRLTARATSWDTGLDAEADELCALLAQVGTSSATPVAADSSPDPRSGGLPARPGERDPGRGGLPARPGERDPGRGGLPARTGERDPGRGGLPARPGESSDQSIRQFVGREAAAVAGALRDAAHSLTDMGAPSTERLGRVSTAMHSLRGLAGLTELAPLPDLLDATDTAVRELLRYPALPAGAAELCLNGAEAFGRIARDVASRGRTDPELPEAHRFADQLRQVLNGPESVVPIDDLDGGAAVLRRPEPRFSEPLDLSSLGERMRAGADQLRAAPSRAAGRLQCLVLLALLRDAPGGLGRRPAGRFIARVCDALDTASSQGDPVSLAGLLEESGALLVDGARGDLGPLEDALEALGDGTDVVSVESLLEDAAVVEIAELAPDEERPALDLPADRTALERSLSQYSRLVRAGAPPIVLGVPEEEPVSIDSLAPALEAEAEIIAIEALAPELEEEIVEIETLAPEPEPVAIESLAPDEATFGPTDLGTFYEPELAPILAAMSPEPPQFDIAVVPIEELLYHGSGAMARADEVRRMLEVSLQMATTELDRVEPLVRELLDLVPLALVGAD